MTGRPAADGVAVLIVRVWSEGGDDTPQLWVRLLRNAAVGAGPWEATAAATRSDVERHIEAWLDDVFGP